MSAARLSLAEELVLIALDDESGRLVGTGARTMALDRSIAAALLMELALARRIDTDTEALSLLSAEPIGDALADRVLAEIAATPARLPSGAWVQKLSAQGQAWRESLIARLVERGILRQVEQRLLWVFRQRTYPPADGEPEREVRTRILALLHSDDIPAPRDALLVGLLQAGGLFNEVMPHDALQALRPRIAAIADLEEMSRSLRRTVEGLQRAVSVSPT